MEYKNRMNVFLLYLSNLLLFFPVMLSVIILTAEIGLMIETSNTSENLHYLQNTVSIVPSAPFHTLTLELPNTTYFVYSILFILSVILCNVFALRKLQSKRIHILGLMLLYITLFFVLNI